MRFFKFTSVFISAYRRPFFAALMQRFSRDTVPILSQIVLLLHTLATFSNNTFLMQTRYNIDANVILHGYNDSVLLKTRYSILIPPSLHVCTILSRCPRVPTTIQMWICIDTNVRMHRFNSAFVSIQEPTNF